MKCDFDAYEILNGQKIESCTLMPNQGYCNENYLLQTDKEKYHLRKFKLTTIDRKREFELQHLAFEAGIAPEPFLLDEANELMLCSFIEGEHLESLSEFMLTQLAATVRKLHRTPCRCEPMQLEDSFASKTPEVSSLLESLTTFDPDLVLCHNDLNPKNILFSEQKITLIDWEYAGLNDRYFDLASASVEFKMNESEEKLFCETYFGGGEVKREKLDVYKAVYKMLCEQWFEVLK